MEIKDAKLGRNYEINGCNVVCMNTNNPHGYTCFVIANEDLRGIIKQKNKDNIRISFCNPSHSDALDGARGIGCHCIMHGESWFYKIKPKSSRSRKHKEMLASIDHISIKHASWCFNGLIKRNIQAKLDKVKAWKEKPSNRQKLKASTQ